MNKILLGLDSLLFDCDLAAVERHYKVPFSKIISFQLLVFYVEHLCNLPLLNSFYGSVLNDASFKPIHICMCFFLLFVQVLTHINICVFWSFSTAQSKDNFIEKEYLLEG